MQTAPAVGEPAPPFRLAGTGGREYALEDYRGAPVVLVFYPADGSPVCTLQLRTYSDDLDAFAALGAPVLGIGPQDPESHERFATLAGLRFPLLSDEDRAVGQAYGVLGPVGFYRRSVFVLRPDHTIAYARRARAGLSFRPTRELLAALEDVVGPVPPGAGRHSGPPPA